MISASRLLEELEAHEAADAAERDSLERIRALLRGPEDPFGRGRPEHVTASAVVAHPRNRRFLLVFHRRLERWLQPGGHVEAEDASVLAAARREVEEETGARRLEAARGGSVLDVDVHPIPPRHGRPGHVHFDVRYLLTTEDEAASPAPEEVRAVRWFSLAEALASGVDASLERALTKALAWLTAERSASGRT